MRSQLSKIILQQASSKVSIYMSTKIFDNYYTSQTQNFWYEVTLKLIQIAQLYLEVSSFF